MVQEETRANPGQILIPSAHILHGRMNSASARTGWFSPHLLFGLRPFRYTSVHAAMPRPMIHASQSNSSSRNARGCMESSRV